MASNWKTQKILFILSASLFLLALFPSHLPAGILTLAWDANNEDDLGGYKVYYGTRSIDYDFVIDVGNVTQYTVRGLEPETLYYLALTAYDISRNESDFSGEVSAVADEDPAPSSSPSAALIDSDDGGGCFIATAAYGSYLNPHVETLRDFRDRLLVPGSLGRNYVRLYYHYAPTIANLIKKHGSLQCITRHVLLPLIWMSSLSLKITSSPTLLFPLLCLFSIFATTLRVYLRPKR
jgi:hypothetical protein